jgi:hypothetical protein
MVANPASIFFKSAMLLLLLLNSYHRITGRKSSLMA